MEITEIKVFPVQEEKLKAFVSVVFDRCFMVNDIKIIQGRQGLFISMPSRKKKNGEFKDVAHPLNNDTRQMIEGQVLNEYDRVLEERAAGEGSQARRAPKRRVEPRESKKADVPQADDAGGDGSRNRGGATETRRRRRRSRAEPVTAETAGAGQTDAGGAKGEETKAETKKAEEIKSETTTGEGKKTAASAAEIRDSTGKGEEEDSAEKTLEEIEEMHLRDSFWSVP